MKRIASLEPRPPGPSEPATQAAFRFHPEPAEAALADLVESIWTARGVVGYGRERILPTTSPVLIVNLGSPFRVRASASGGDSRIVRHGWLVGPQTGYIENEPLAETDVVGATLRPWGAASLFDLRGEEIRDRIIDLELLWGPGLESLRQQLASLSGGRRRHILFGRALLARRRSGPPRVIGQATARLAVGPASVDLVTRELGVSRKHLNALFDRHVGLSPRAYARVQRFDRALRALALPEPPALAYIAQEHGYYDQAHMNRDFVAFGSVTPTEYLRLRARHMTEDGDASGLFVPGL